MMKPDFSRGQKGLLKIFASIAFCFFLGFSGTVFGQASSYIIESSGSYDQTDFENAIRNAKWDSYRKPVSRVTLTFDKGASVTLLSGTELTQNGTTFNAAYMLPESTPANPSRVFSLHPSGVVMESIQVKQGK